MGNSESMEAKGENSSCFVYLFPGGSVVKNLPANARDTGSILGLGRSVLGLGRSALEKEMTTHSSIFTWEIPYSEEPGRPGSKGSQRVRHS